MFCGAGWPGRLAPPEKSFRAGVVVGHLVAAPNVGKRDFRSSYRFAHDASSMKVQVRARVHPLTKTSVIFGRPLLHTEVVGMSSLAGLRPAGRRSSRRAGFRPRRARSPYVAKADEIRYLDIASAALDQIANSRFSKIVYRESENHGETGT